MSTAALERRLDLQSKPIASVLAALVAALGAVSGPAFAHGAAPALPRSSAPAPSENPVRLVWATMVNHGCSSCQETYGVIEVMDRGYDKAVDVFYESYPSSEWPSVSATRVRTLAGNRELWAFKGIPVSPARLAIRLRTGGQVFWDNNGGRDYRLGTGSASGDSRILGPGSSGVSVVEATFEVAPGARNLLTVKLIGPSGADAALVYSTNGWFRTSEAVAVRTARGQEFDEFTVQVELPTRDVRFAGVARQGDEERWDNACGENFFCGMAGPFEPVRCSGGSILPRELGY